MAKERTIRDKAKKELIEMGYVVCVPNRSRFGAFSTYFQDEHKQGDDLFGIFDLVAWKEDEILFVQYTSHAGVYARRKKIETFMKENNCKVPKGCRIEVWGYTDRKGFKNKLLITGFTH